MIYMRAKGGETLQDAIKRAIDLAVHSSDIVHLVYERTAIDVHPTWHETAEQMWREKFNAKVKAPHV